MVVYRGKSVMIDCGETWLRQISHLRPCAIVITHAHPDHAFGLKHGAPCHVYATTQAWETLKRFPIPPRFRKVVEPGRTEVIGDMMFDTFPVIHSVLAPAVGYRISAGGVDVFYVPDVARILDRSRAFAGIRTYIGDGAVITRSLLRRDRRYGRLIGHASIQAHVTHCGSAIVSRDAKGAEKTLESFSDKYGVRLKIAHDGMEIVLRRMQRRHFNEAFL
jgi:phosphoribosyl 1,2-cyclic phosphodiesterase